MITVLVGRKKQAKDTKSELKQKIAMAEAENELLYKTLLEKEMQIEILTEENTRLHKRVELQDKLISMVRDW